MVTQRDTPELRAVADAQRAHLRTRAKASETMAQRTAAMEAAVEAGATLAEISRAAGITLEAVSKALGRREGVAQTTNADGAM